MEGGAAGFQGGFMKNLPVEGARRAPTIHGWAFRSCIVGATLAVALEAARGQFQQSLT